MLNLYWVFFSDLHLVETFLFFLTLLKINWMWTLTRQLFKVCTRSIALGVGPVQIWQHGYHSNVYHVVLRFWLPLGRSLYYFLVFLLLTLNIFCLLLISLDATFWNVSCYDDIIFNFFIFPCSYSFIFLLYVLL